MERQEGKKKRHPDCEWCPRTWFQKEHINIGICDAVEQKFKAEFNVVGGIELEESVGDSAG